MEFQDVASLNRFYSRHKKLFFEEGPNGFPLLKIRTERARATVAMYGAQLVSYKPGHSAHDLFYLSEQAIYQPGKAIRGGVPLCWPWFGDDPDGKGRQAHGFVRNMFWELLDTRIYDNVVIATFGMESNKETKKKWWKQDFKLQKTMTLGDDLTISLTTENTGKKPLTLSEALHSYFLIGDINQTTVAGLDSCLYLDKTMGFAQEQQHGDIKVKAEYDRIFIDSPNAVVINDPVLERRILVKHSGAENFVIWNPWDKAASMADLPDDGYQQFLCVETANALANCVTVQPGESHTMEVHYEIESSCRVS
jgi:glucose-6-phosphate 1-epimerase